MSEALREEDYREPRCPMDLRVSSRSAVPISRILEKTDEALSREDYAEADRLLRYWLGEARDCGDERGELALLSEQMGLNRKLGRETEAVSCAEQALALTERLGLSDSVSGATFFLNAATVYDAFRREQDALPLFETARSVLEAQLPWDDPLLAGLYNNMGLCLCSLGQYTDGLRLFRNALSVLAELPEPRGELAVTWLNIADALENSGEPGQIPACMAEARAILEGCPRRDGGYAFILKKCAPAFRHRGEEAYAAELETRAEAIYAGA